MMAIRREDLIPEILDMAGVAPLTSAIASGDQLNNTLAIVAQSSQSAQSF
jgi:hypothetical protein